VYEKDIASCDSSYIAIDSRMCNNNIKPLYRLAKRKGLKIVGDIRNAKDYENLIKCGCVPDYVATTFSVFDRPCNPELVAEIKSIDMGQKVIAEGGYSNYNQIESAINNGACAVCIGREITGIDLKTIGYKGIIDAVHN
jgi:putative N-acetylmannosamine-6-phosphate epimerase